MRIAKINAYILRQMSSLRFPVLRQLKQQFLNNGRICKSIVFGVKVTPPPLLLRLKTVINMINNRRLTFPLVDMTWLDSDGKYHILCWVSILEIITMFRMKPSYLKKT